jgi:predicted RNA-binding Zn ribbon-like protein
MPWFATDRFELRRAPGSFALVQDLLNTVAGNRDPLPDLLTELDSAQEWLDGAVAAWSEARGQEIGAVTLAPRDLAPLRELRAQVYDVVAETDDDSGSHMPLGAELSIPVTVVLRADREFAVEPRGSGWRWVASAILAECYLAQRLGLWRRLKTCRNQRCPVTFYDHSRNNSSVWHDVRTCGNVANLRASRARRRAEAATP